MQLTTLESVFVAAVAAAASAAHSIFNLFRLPACVCRKWVTWNIL